MGTETETKKKVRINENDLNEWNLDEKSKIYPHSVHVTLHLHIYMCSFLVPTLLFLYYYLFIFFCIHLYPYSGTFRLFPSLNNAFARVNNKNG